MTNKGRPPSTETVVKLRNTRVRGQKAGLRKLQARTADKIAEKPQGAKAVWNWGGSQGTRRRECSFQGVAKRITPDPPAHSMAK